MSLQKASIYQIKSEWFKTSRNVNSSCFLLLCFIFLQCHSLPRNDVYKELPIGTILSKNILLKSEQVCKNNSDLILLVNFSSNPAMYDPYLLFYDSSLKLYSACYFASEKIESIKDDTIKAFLNESRESRKFSYRNDLPPNYYLSMQKIEGESGRISNKIIDSILIDPRSLITTLYIRKAKNMYEGVNWIPNNPNSISKTSFITRDTISHPISEFHFDFNNRIVSYRKIDSANRLIWDEMIVLDKSILNKFYDELYKIL